MFSKYCMYSKVTVDKIEYSTNCTPRYKNITQNQITNFLTLCEACEQKKTGLEKGMVLNRRVFNEFSTLTFASNSI